MKLFILVLCMCQIGIPFVQSATIPTDNQTQDRNDSAAGSKGYIIVAGGHNSNGYVASSFAYDINAGTWSPLPSLLTASWGGSLVAHRGNVYHVAGYSSGGGLKEVVVLVTAKKSWFEGPPLETIDYMGVNALSLNGSLYALGGNTNHIEKFDCDSGRYLWKPVAPMQKTHYYSGAAVLNGYIYVCGTTVNNPSTFCERYDPASDAWSSITPMNEARDKFSMVSLNGYLYVIGGADANNERYDPENDEWIYFSSMQTQKWFNAPATDGKNIYVVGGANDAGCGIKDVNAYYPDFDIWQMKTSYEIEICDAGAAFVEKLP